MPIYLYFCKTCDKEFEAEHSIHIELEECPTCKANNIKSDKPVRLISGGINFSLVGDGWAKDNYSK